MALTTPETSDRFSVPAQFKFEDQGTAFSEEILKLSQPSLNQSKIVESQLPTPPQTDKAPDLANAAVDKLPALTVEGKPAAPAEHKLGGGVSTALDIGIGAAVIIGAEAAAAVIFKSPKMAALVAETLEAGGKMAFLTSPKLMAPTLGTLTAAYGAGTVARHYAVEGLTGQSESWGTSFNNVGFGVLAFQGTRYISNKLAPDVPITKFVRTA